MKRTHALCLLLPACCILLIGCAKHDEQPAPARPVRTMRVSDVEAFTSRVFPGRAEAVQAVDIAFEVQGTLSERPANVGDVVTQGQVLARLDPRDYENDVRSAEAQLTRAQAYRERIEKVTNTGAVAEQDLTDAQAQFDVAEANLKVKTKALADTQITAPFAGTIAATFAENFQNVRVKEPVIRLIDLSRIELKIDVPEQLISLVPTVKDITVTFEAHPESPVPAAIKEIGAEASATTRTYPITLIMDQPSEFQILPGMTGQVRGRPDVATIPAEAGIQVLVGAVFEEDQKHFVWIVDEKAATVHRREVATQGVTSRGIRVQGLEAGELIVTAGAHYLSEGQSVRLSQSGEKADESS